MIEALKFGKTKMTNIKLPHFLTTVTYQCNKNHPATILHFFTSN